jgi:hypothetical protein
VMRECTDRASSCFAGNSLDRARRNAAMSVPPLRIATDIAQLRAIPL